MYLEQPEIAAEEVTEIIIADLSPLLPLGLEEGAYTLIIRDEERKKRMLMDIEANEQDIAIVMIDESILPGRYSVYVRQEGGQPLYIGPIVITEEPLITPVQILSVAGEVVPEITPSAAVDIGTFVHSDGIIIH